MSGRIQIGDSFLILAALVVFLDEEGVGQLFLAAAALHETGHALAVQLCRGQILCLRLTAVGGVLRYRLHRPNRVHDLLIAAAGPLAGLLAAMAAARAGCYTFAGANLLLSLFNLLPIRPLDGGQILYALLGGRPAQVRVETLTCLAAVFTGLWSAMHGGGVGLLLLSLLLWQQQKTYQGRTHPCGGKRKPRTGPIFRR